jgi:hypothetical protein
MHSLLKSVPDAEPFQDDCLAEFATRDDDRDHLLDGPSSRSWPFWRQPVGDYYRYQRHD